MVLVIGDDVEYENADSFHGIKFCPLVLFIKPVITDAYNTSTTSIVVKWDKIPSNRTQSLIVAYEVQIYRNDSRDKPVKRVMVNCENVTIKGLERYTPYVIMVAGATIGGKGPYSDPVVCFTDEDSKLTNFRF